MSEDDKDGNDAMSQFAAVVPLHAATQGTSRTREVKRGRGRPKKVNPKPSADDLVYHAEMIRQKNQFIEADELVKAARSRQEALDVLQIIKAEVAREAAALHFARIEEEKYGRETSALSMRRVNALREIANLEGEIKKIGVTMIDLKSERFQKIFQLFMETIRESAVEVLTPEQVNLFFNRLETRFEGWEERAQAL